MSAPFPRNEHTVVAGSTGGLVGRETDVRDVASRSVNEPTDESRKLRFSVESVGPDYEISGGCESDVLHGSSPSIMLQNQLFEKRH
jgi:hypothetical protein